MATTKNAEKLAALNIFIDSTTALIQSFENALRNSSSSTTPQIPQTDSPNPLQLLRDASAILKARTTQLSLLIINKPFTPSAITGILSTLSCECLPALMSTLELCPPVQYTEFLHQHIRTLLSRAFKQLSILLSAIPRDEQGSEKTPSHETVASTGLLWGTCDDMAKLATTGLTALAVEKGKLYHSLIEDAIAELKDWDPEEETDDEDTNSDTEADPTPMPKPKPSPSCIPQLSGKALSLLRLIHLLFVAVLKRRIPLFPTITSTPTTTSSSTSAPNSSPPPTRSQCQILDALMSSLRSLPEQADEIAGALYEGDEQEVLKRLVEMREMGKGVLEGLRVDWRGQEDGFGDWVGRWVRRVEELDFGVDGSV